MNSENTNGVNVNAGPNINPASTDANLPPQENKPTLDSILNSNPIEEPVTSAPTVENQPVETPVTPNVDATVAPTIETIPVDEPSAPVTPVEEVTNEAPAPEIETLEDTLEEESTPTEGVVTESVNPDIPLDDFNAVPVPPVMETNKKKKEKKESSGNSKTILIVILLFILIAAIGFGVYYFLTTAKKGSGMVSITIKEVKLELGSTLSNNIDTYATIAGYNKNNCNLDLSNVNVNKVSVYKYTITCGTKKVEGSIIVDDSTEPEVITNELTVMPGAEIVPEDFIEKCIDASNCTYEFAEKVSTDQMGEFNINIIIKDEYNNKTTATAKLIVSDAAPIKFLTCTAEEKDIDDIYATLIDSYKIGIDADDNFYNATRISTFKFADSKDYQNSINNYSKETGLNNIKGIESANEIDQTITIKSDKTLEEMGEDLNVTLPNNANQLSNWMWGVAGYTCK